MKKYLRTLDTWLFKSKVSNPCKGCKWFERYPKQTRFNHIGWCKRFKPDPDGGYIKEFGIPPCACWDFEAKKELGGGEMKTEKEIKAKIKAYEEYLKKDIKEKWYILISDYQKKINALKWVLEK